MRDRDVRTALRAQALSQHYEDPETLVIDELGLLNGRARVDVAVVNGMIHGYELKSASDTLARLPAQVAAYGAVLDLVTIVIAEEHYGRAAKLLPAWWGVTIATEDDAGCVLLADRREATMNPEIDPCSLATLLWRDEVIEELELLGVAAGVRSKPRRDLYRRLTEAVPLQGLRAIVRTRLKRRAGWRPAAQRT